MSKRFAITFGVAVLLVCGFVMPAQADINGGGGGTPGDDPPLIVGGGWQSFFWANAPPAFNSDGPFTFNSAMPVYLKVTDGFLDGDQFNVYDFGGLIGTTSVPTDTGANIGSDADAAFADARWSSGMFLLGAGAHSITMETIAIPAGYPGGQAFLRADVVPVPGAALLGVVGLGMVGWMRRRFR